MWWDEETDGELMYPAQSRNTRPRRSSRASQTVRNPERGGGAWQPGPIPGFLENLDRPQPADATKHAVRRLPRPRLGLPSRVQEGPQGRTCSTTRAQIVPEPPTPEKLAWPPSFPIQARGFPQAITAPIRKDVRREETERDPPARPCTMMDIHMEKGMHCVDCHFVQDMHGNTRLHQRSAGRDRDPPASTATARPTKFGRHSRRPARRRTPPAERQRAQPALRPQMRTPLWCKTCDSRGASAQALPEFDGREGSELGGVADEGPT